MGKRIKKTTPVVVLAYNRPRSLEQLLVSLNKAHYSGEKPELIISIDAGAPEEVINVAETFHFKFGPKRIINRDKSLGFKKHILTCGDISETDGSVIILKDGLIMSSEYFLYATRALSEYRSEDKVAGISLYSQRFNETAQLPFEPMPDENSTYFMQLACSRGQAWTAEQWGRFKKWLANNETIEEHDELPQNMKLWGKDSWKKLLNIYLLKSQTYFAYPYRSYTTNDPSQGGQNLVNKGGLFQVPIGLYSNGNPVFRFPSFKNQPIRYDMFMEYNAARMAMQLELAYHELCVDLYGTKPDSILKKHNYVITPRTGGEPLRSFRLSLKPMELNILNPLLTEGKPFFHLYAKDQLRHLKPLSKRQFAEMATYFSYVKPAGSQYLKEYISDLFSKIFLKR